MPRKPRIEIAGQYHIVNRGVEQRVVFVDREDYERFEELMGEYAKSYTITIHNYCLMSNHYHLLIEISSETLSKFMRQLNMNYAIYFNKKYKRSGHLWQGRYKSWYITDEAYLYTLMCYIEQNPLKANIVQKLEEYPYSSYHHFLNYPKIPHLLKSSFITQNYQYDKDAIVEFLTQPIDSSQLQELKKASTLVEAPNRDNSPKEELLQNYLQGITDKKERNKQIVKAYQQGYSQHMIAKVLGISQQAVCGIIKRGKRGVVVVT